ncbi:nucleotidyltransferase family protein [Shimia sediminis]|uniref:nucleotidyltransferase family protein n=1 Tax=Shimia sediminis TaxID=2497945 RepID=UPI000F8CB440|nr:nucleotidyltransferase family protein [Shimia sediminis]
MLTILLLAAGSSSRMRGQDKLMQEVDGQPLIRTMATRARDTGCPLIIALPPNPGPRQSALAGLPFQACPVADADKGMAHSIRAAVAALRPEVTALMVLPSDMPDLGVQDLNTMISAWRKAPPETILRGSSAKGQPGHPVIFPRSDFSELQALSGDQGARGLLRANADRVHLVPLPDHHALTDLDTPEDWATWRNARR